MTLHSRGFLTVVLAVTLAGAGALIYQLVASRRDRQAAEAFQTVAKALSEEAADSKKVLNDLDEFLAKHGSSSLGPTANLYKGKLLLKSGKQADALAAYKTAESKLSRPFSYLAREGEGNALMELKKFPEAEAAFKTLSDAKDNPMKAEHLWSLGLAQEAQNKPDQALVTYRAFESQYKDSAMLEKVRSRIALLQKK
jgi:hypothetical protein